MIVPLHADGHAALPIPPTRLVGREREAAALDELLASDRNRLVTLTGPGGVGKTHLALEVAGRAVPRFPDGVVFVPLASVTDPALVLPTIALALGLRENPGQAHAELLRDALAGKQVLLLLDNLEQVIDAGPDIGNLLAAAEGPRALATSREPLRLRIEREFPVQPLPLPRPDTNMASGALAANPSVALFVERAQSVRPAFALTDDNASAVAGIARRLDGLPLAIELAAAMTRAMSPRAMLVRMDQRLRVLVWGAADLPERQRTLRNAIAWSHDLLDPDERVVFRRLAVFAGGASLDAIEAVSGDLGAGADAVAPTGIAPVVTTLVAKSLLVHLDEGDVGHVPDEPRYRMLDTIHEFAAEQLDASGEADTVRRRHLDWLLGLVERAETGITGPDQVRWLKRLDAEYDNIRAALVWAIDHCPAAGMRLATMLWRYWATHGQLSEGHTWLSRFLDAPVDAAPDLRARAFGSLGNLSLDLGDYPAAAGAYEHALWDWEALGNPRGIADTLNGQGLVDWYRGDYASARRRHEQSLELRRRIGDRFGQGNSLSNLGNAIKDAGDPLAARELHRQALELRQSLGHRVGVGYSLLNLGDVARRLGDASEARAMFDRSLEEFRTAGDTLGIGYAMQGLGLAAMLAGDAPRAGGHFAEALEIRSRLGDRRGVVESVEGIASVATSLGRLDLAATLFGAAEGLREQIGARMPGPDREMYEPVVASIRHKLPTEVNAARWAAGGRLSLPEAAQMALTAAREVVATPEANGPAGRLSEREVEVLRLVAAGMTNAQVAERLYLSRRTVDAHLRRIYDKLDLPSRAEAIRFAIDNGIA